MKSYSQSSLHNPVSPTSPASASGSTSPPRPLYAPGSPMTSPLGSPERPSSPLSPSSPRSAAYGNPHNFPEMTSPDPSDDPSAAAAAPTWKERARQLLSRSVVFLILVFTQLSFGGYSVISKVALTDGVDPVVFSFLRDVMATPLLLLGAWYFEGLPRPSKQDLFLFFLLGLTGIYGNQLFFILGVNYTTSVNASLMQPSIPVFTTFLAVLFKVEVLDPRALHGLLKILGIILSVVGAVIVIVLAGNEEVAENIVLGNICLIINCCSFAIYAILQKSVLSRYPPVTVSAWSYAFGCMCIGMSLLGCPGDPGEPVTRWYLPTSSLYALCYGAFLCSALCYALLSWCNNKTSPTTVTAFWPLQVIASMFLSAIFLDYHIIPSDIIGAVLVGGGLFCVILAKWVQERQKAAQAIAVPDDEKHLLPDTPINDQAHDYGTHSSRHLGKLD